MDDIPLLIGLLILSGFFSGAEIALFSLGPEKIQAIKNKTRNKKLLNRIKRLEILKSEPNKLLVTILIGNNVANVAASAMATVLALKIGEDLGFLESTSLIIGIVTGVMTFLILIFGEITPKALAHKHALQFSLIAAPIIRILQIILYPIVLPISHLTQKFTGKKPYRHGLSEDELKAAIELSEKEGQIDADERELVEKILEFDEHDVESIMTPQSKIFALPDDMPVPKALEEISKEKFSRIPIYHDKHDEIIGILRVQALIPEMLKPSFREKNIANLPLLSPLKIPLTMKIDTLLREFQAQKNHMAFVYNEHGGFIGLITLEDVLEEIFGEFEDEHDKTEPGIRRIGKHKFSCSAETELEQIENFIREELGTTAPQKRWPWTLEEENKTVSYFLLEKFERFPEPGEKIEITENGRRFTFTVKKIENEKIETVEFSVI